MLINQICAIKSCMTLAVKLFPLLAQCAVAFLTAPRQLGHKPPTDYHLPTATCQPPPSTCQLSTATCQLSTARIIFCQKFFSRQKFLFQQKFFSPENTRLGAKGPTVAAEGCSPPQELEKSRP